MAMVAQVSYVTPGSLVSIVISRDKVNEWENTCPYVYIYIYIPQAPSIMNVFA